MSQHPHEVKLLYPQGAKAAALQKEADSPVPAPDAARVPDMHRAAAFRRGYWPGFAPAAPKYAGEHTYSRAAATSESGAEDPPPKWRYR